MSLLDFEGEKRPSRFRLKPAKVFIALGSVCAMVLGYTFAGNITLNDNQAVEFGQGMVRTVACDQDGLTLTPYSAFINGDSNFTPITLTANSNGLESGRVLYSIESLYSIKIGDSVQGSGIPEDSFITNITGAYFAINNSYSEEITSRTLTISRPPGRFLLNAIELADIDAENCANKALTIKVYNSTSSSSLATYEVFSNGNEVTSVSGQIEISFDNEGEAAIFLTIEEPTVAATDVYRITIESTDQTNLTLNRIGLWPGFSCGGTNEECLVPSSSDESDFYCADGVCNIVFLTASTFIELLIEQCESSGGGDQCLDAALLASSTYSLSENNSEDPEMGWQILITPPGSFGPFQNTLHLSGQILYSNGQYAVFRWFVNTGEDPTDERTYADLIISLSGSLPTSNPYTGPPFFGEGPEITLYQLNWNY